MIQCVVNTSINISQKAKTNNIIQPFRKEFHPPGNCAHHSRTSTLAAAPEVFFLQLTIEYAMQPQSQWKYRIRCEWWVIPTPAGAQIAKKHVWWNCTKEMKYIQTQFLYCITIDVAKSSNYFERHSENRTMLLFEGCKLHTTRLLYNIWLKR